MLCQINGNALAIVYLKTAGGRWEKVRYLRLSWKRSLRPCREAGGEVGEPVGRADWIWEVAELHGRGNRISGSRRAGWPSRLDLSLAIAWRPGVSTRSGWESRAWEWIACWATYQAWLASIRTKSVRIDALDLTLLRAFHNARPCPTLSRLRTQCAEPHLRIGPRSTEDPQSIPSSRRTFASEASILAKLTKPESVPARLLGVLVSLPFAPGASNVGSLARIDLAVWLPVAVLWLLLSGLTSVLNLPLTSDDRAKCFLRPESERVFSFSWLGTGSPGLGRRGDRVTGVVDELGEGRANNALPEPRPSGMYS